MFQKKLFKILSLSLSLSVASMGLAFADADQSLVRPISIELTAADEALYEKQAEIDKMLFEKYTKDLEEKGIVVTHTGAIENSIEVGITPYTPENADIVNKLIGDDTVKVVEGTMAVTLQYNPELNEETVDPRVVMDPAELADDSQIVSVTGEVPEEAQPISAPADAVEDAKVISAPVEKEKGISPVVIGAGAVALMGIGALMLKKKTA